jgi:acyl-coenzyme A thioesterase 13
MDDETRQRMREILGRTGFDRALARMELIEMSGGRARVRLPVDDSVVNMARTLHGGAIATLVDIVGTMAIMSADRNGRPGVTTDLNTSYLSAIPEGDAAIADATALKVGRTMAFVTVDLRREKDGVLAAQGRMTKHLGN